MKFCSTLLALGAIVGSASAFVPQTPAFSRTGSALSSTPGYMTQPQQQQQRQQQQSTYNPTSQSTSAASSSRPGSRTGTKLPPIKVQGGSLKTWALRSPAIERVMVNLSTEGRPLDADIDLWHGPDNTPLKMRVYVEDGSKRPFSAVVETPRGPNTVAIRNIGQMEFPIDATIQPNPADNAESTNMRNGPKPPQTIQGGALKTFAFETNVDSVQILLQTDGRPLNSRIELLQGPNNIKQMIELYIEDGMDRPFFMIIETPGSGNVVRVVNTSTVEFPMRANVEPFVIGQYSPEDDIVVGGDGSSDFARQQF